MANPGTSDATHMLRKSTFEQVLREGKFTPPGEISRRDGIEKSACEEVANRLGDGRATIANWYRYVKGTKWEPDLSLWPGRAAIRAPEPQPAVGDELAEAVRKAADRPGGTSLEEIAQETGASIGEVLDAVDILKEQGIAIKRIGDRYEVSRSPLPAFAESQALIEIFSDENNRFRFGALGDNHAASKYERLDVLESLYGHFERAGISKVFHTGNWIDGEARFNRQDIVAFGLEGQARYLAKTYPKHTGITTYAIWGDDHEGWYTREGIDVGRYVEDVMHSEGRTDWRNLGFLEAHVKLVNSNTGASQIMAVVHPGGGSAYAISYKPQKIIESMDGNEKPALVLLGHYHKLEIGNVRNVWYIQTGTTQDQTVFLRKKSIEAHVGGLVVDLEQDPETGAIIECNGMRRYFNRAYYTAGGHANQRWSKHGPIRPAPRSAGGV